MSRQTTALNLLLHVLNSAIDNESIEMYKVLEKINESKCTVYYFKWKNHVKAHNSYRRKEKGAVPFTWALLLTALRPTSSLASATASASGLLRAPGRPLRLSASPRSRTAADSIRAPLPQSPHSPVLPPSMQVPHQTPRHRFAPSPSQMTSPYVQTRRRRGGSRSRGLHAWSSSASHAGGGAGRRRRG